MAVKTNGAEFKRFYSDPKAWPDGVWHDDDVVTVNGVHDSEADLAEIPDAAKVVIESGYMIGEKGEDLGLLTTNFNKWKRSQTHQTVLVEIGKNDGEKLAELLKQIGGKVVA